MLLDEVKAEAEKAEKERRDKDEDMEDAETDKEKEKDVKKEGQGRERNENRDWKRNGLCLLVLTCDEHLTHEVADERWLEWLDNKMALLINRDGVDPRDYCGKSYDE
jgi:hypothetical protein